MSAGFALPPGRAVGSGRPAAAGPSAVEAGHPHEESTRLRLLCFFALASFCGYQYATLLLHPPVLRVLGVAAVATALGAALVAAARPAARWPLRAGLTLVVAVAALALALVTIGVPAGLLLPGRWHTLGTDLDGGFDGLAGWLWPYRGESAWARVTVLALLAPVEVAAAIACFWPAGGRARHGGPERGAGPGRGAAHSASRPPGRAVALGLMLALLVTGLANQTAPAWRVQGAALLVLIAAWLWLPGLAGGGVPRAGRWLLAACVAGLAVAPALDRSRPLLDFRSWNPVAATASFQWDQLYGPIPWSRSDATMLEVAEPHPALLRVTTLDRFDGLRFLRSLAPPGDPAADEPLARSGSGAFVSATVAVAGLRSPLLVTGGGAALRLRWLAHTAPAAATAADGTVTLSPAPAGGARYEVLSYAPSPGVRALRAAPAGYPARYLPYARFALPGPLASNLRPADLTAEANALQPGSTLVGAPSPGRAPASDRRMARRIAASPYGPAFALAQRLAAGAPTRYDVAARVEQYLRSGYTYDEHPPPARYPLEAFLFSDRRGYCQQFSGAMALLLRMDGIPARIAAGFRPGAYDQATGRATVTALDAHSWVEVFFAGIGWVPFDPTPPRTTTAPVPAVVGLPQRPVASRGAGAASSPAAQRARSVSGPRTDRHGGGAAWWPLAVMGVLGALALAGGVWWTAAALRLRRSLDGDGAAAVAELRAALASVEQGAGAAEPGPPAPTLAALERRLAGRRGGRASAHLRALRERRYGAGTGERPSSRGRRELRRALGEGTGLRARLRLLLALPPGGVRRS